MLKKNNILNANYVQEMIERTMNLYRRGWDERNGGNISYLLEENERLPFLNPTQVIGKFR